MRNFPESIAGGDGMTLRIPTREDGQRTESRSLKSKLVETVDQNPWNRLILQRAHELGVSDWWLTSGCVAQSIWNVISGRAIDAGIRDYDLVYFDADTSWEAEDAVIAKARTLFADVPVEVQVRNQARVPLWYETKYGIPFGAVSRASDC
jgi:hypothetical protein